MPKPTKQLVIDAIVKQIGLGKSYGTVLKVNETKWRLTKSTFNRYWKIAGQQHTERQQALKKELDEVQTAAAIEALKREILTIEERKEILTKIAKGLVKVPYDEVRWNYEDKIFEKISFEELPGHNSRIAAIAELNKMEGAHAPTKIANTDAEGKDIPPMTNTQVMEIIKSLRETAAT